MKRFVSVNTPVFNGNENKYLLDCIDSGWVSSDGPYVKRFEKNMASFVGRKFGIAVCNGTAALEDAVLALNIDRGAEVILPDFTIISCAQAIVKAGLIPIPIDCDRNNWNINVSLIEEKITDNTKAIMVAHIYGLPVDMDPLMELARKYNLLVIEDAAEAHGLTYKGHKCGSFGDVSTFSFYPNKLITSGEGGMVLADEEEIAERSKKIRNLFFDTERRYIHEEIGSNFRLTNIQAALGLAQLEQIEKTIARKREIGNIYQEELNPISCIDLPISSCEYADNLYWVFGIVLRDSNCPVDMVMKKLKEKGIATRHFFYPLHKQPALTTLGCFPERVNDDEYPNTNYISEHGFYIPSGLGLTYEDQKYVIKSLKSILGD